ncbi:uncharacterized protein EV420DRAFT_635958 [Desarmillaria tabescens]|uniref:Uncharacterized protein n=1 Tax=Armillaria tabescens TaxID=1929756 RepID=A0AA39K293_ARMTA|nr:uncharacterized protein EV420DRAFT_635958 [Desarmillaria tabescens]KAK0453012.1 hypothetical protein EV420DRAFT_635958 [Desarmillaria tabescens]
MTAVRELRPVCQEVLDYDKDDLLALHQKHISFGRMIYHHTKAISVQLQNSPCGVSNLFARLGKPFCGIVASMVAVGTIAISLMSAIIPELSDLFKVAVVSATVTSALSYLGNAALLLNKVIPVRNSLYQEVITHIGLWLELRRVIIRDCPANKNHTLDAAEKHYFLRSFQRAVIPPNSVGNLIMKERNLAARPRWGLKAAEDEPLESGVLIVDRVSAADPVHSSSNNVGHQDSMPGTHTARRSRNTDSAAGPSSCLID